MNSNKLFMVQLVVMICALFLTTSIIFYFEISSLERNGVYDDDRFDRNKQLEIFEQVHSEQKHALGTELASIEMGGVFQCKDGSNKFAIMNDDYCDCADGT